MTPKKSYTKPVVTDHGTLEQLTAGGSFAGNLDGTYPVGTPSTQGLFS